MTGGRGASNPAASGPAAGRRGARFRDPRRRDLWRPRQDRVRGRRRGIRVDRPLRVVRKAEDEGKKDWSYLGFGLLFHFVSA